MSNVYSKLQKTRTELLEKPLKKSGKNAFAKFSYFELADFVPTVTHLLEKNGLCSATTFDTDSYDPLKQLFVLTIFNVDEPTDKIEFKIPYVMPQMKGANPIQELGAGITYCRRYCYLMALDLVENDVIDALPQEKDTTKPTRADSKGQPIGAERGAEINRIALTKDLDQRAFVQWVVSTFNVTQFEQLTEEQEIKVLEMLARKPDKQGAQ